MSLSEIIPEPVIEEGRHSLEALQSLPEYIQKHLIDGTGLFYDEVLPAPMGNIGDRRLAEFHGLIEETFVHLTDENSSIVSLFSHKKDPSFISAFLNDRYFSTHFPPSKLIQLPSAQKLRGSISSPPQIAYSKKVERVLHL